MNALSSACRLLACHRFVLPSHETNKPERHVNRKQRDFYDVKHERHHHTMAAEFHQQPLDLKMVFLGDSAVGKTALLRRFNTGFPPEEDQPAPADAYSFTDSIQLDGKKYLVRCWEVGLWAEGYERLRPLSYPGTDVFLLCFDIKNRASFTNIKDSWIPEICHHMPYTPFLLVGNKMDLRKEGTIRKILGVGWRWGSCGVYNLHAFFQTNFPALEIFLRYISWQIVLISWLQKCLDYFGTLCQGEGGGKGDSHI